MFERLHVGRGAVVGPLTLFPVWTEVEAAIDYVLPRDTRSLYQVFEAPNAGTMTARNTSGRPLLFLEGQLITGTTPNRIVRQSVLIGAEQSAPVEVAYAGMERWGFDGLPLGRKISSRVFAAQWLEHREQQPGVLGRFAEHIPIIEPLVSSVRAFPGQVGVVIGIDGHPILAEIFDRPKALNLRLQQMVAAVLYDVLAFSPSPGPSTPAGRAQGFLNAAAQVPLLDDRRALGAEGILGGYSDLVAIDACQWRGHVLHMVATNNKHFRNRRA